METNLRKFSMSVALPIISCLHLGQMHGLKPDLVIWSMLYAYLLREPFKNVLAESVR